MNIQKKSSVRLNIARVLLVIGLLIGYTSLSKTLGHIGSPGYLLVAASTEGPTHGWYHVFREGVGDIMSIIILLFVFFGKNVMRTKATWFISLFIMFGYYAPFWIGTPFLPALGAPHLGAELVHIGMAAFSTVALFLARKDFFGNRNMRSQDVVS